MFWMKQSLYDILRINFKFYINVANIIVLLMSPFGKCVKSFIKEVLSKNKMVIRANFFLKCIFIKNFKNTRILLGNCFFDFPKNLGISKIEKQNSLYKKRNHNEIFIKFLKILRFT